MSNFRPLARRFGSLAVVVAAFLLLAPYLQGSLVVKDSLCHDLPQATATPWLGPHPLILPPADGSFKIWVYPFGEEFLRQGRLGADFRTNGSAGPLINDPGYVWDFLLADVVRDPSGPFAPYVTDDPDQATLRFVPMYPVTMMHSQPWLGMGKPAFGSKVVPLVFNVLNRVQNEYPYWNATLGTDHIYVMAHDNGFITIANETIHKIIGAGICVQPLGSYLRFDGFRSNKDVVVSPYERVVVYAAGLYAGNVQLNNPAYSGGVRQWIYKNLRNTTGFAIYSTGDDKNTPEYNALLDNSIFCLYLPGYLPQRWSGRLIHLLTAGCIPVVIMDDMELPFEHILDWSLFSVRVTESQLYAGYLPSILEAIPSERRKKMASIVQQVAKLLSSPYVSNPTSGVATADPEFNIDGNLNVFHLIISTLYIRARRLGLLKP